MSSETDQALSFGAAAREYDAWRPSYPETAVAWAVSGDQAGGAAGASAGATRDAGAAGATAPGSSTIVVELGAGTGILTRVLLGLGYRVIPVEPDAAMRERLTAVTSGAQALAGSAEAIPVADGAAGAVLAGQAYHWFDKRRAHPEIARVLRHGGVLAPIWNIRDESVPWVARLSEIADGARSARDDARGGGEWPDGEFQEPMDDREFGQLFGPLFGPVRRRVFRRSVPMTADGLVALMRTRSYYLVAAPEERAAMERQVRELAGELPESFELPYITAVYRAARR